VPAGADGGSCPRAHRTDCIWNRAQRPFRGARGAEAPAADLRDRLPGRDLAPRPKVRIRPAVRREVRAHHPWPRVCERLHRAHGRRRPARALRGAARAPVTGSERLKGEEGPIAEILALDRGGRKHLHAAETVKSEQNRLSKEFAKTRDDALKERLREMADQAKSELAEAEAVKHELDDLLLRVPNVFHESVPVGETEKDNLVVREVGSKRELGFAARTHYVLV